MNNAGELAIPAGLRRFTLVHGYVVDRYVFQVVSVLVLLLAGTAVALYGWQTHLYVSCPVDARGGWCRNPFYDNFGFCDAPKQELCTLNIIPAGVTLGEKPREGPTVVLLLIGVVVVAGVIVNHVWHNTGEVLRWKY